jgi:hypothetical protein
MGEETELKIADEDKSRVTDESLLKQQSAFEAYLLKTYLPDAIIGKDIYIYRNLILPWYKELSGKSRYNNDVAQKLRNDLSDYMHAMEDAKTYSFLSAEAKDEIERNSFDAKQEIAARRKIAIEDAFAWNISKDEVNELARIRSLHFYAFQPSGDMVPEGYELDGDRKLRLIKHD